MGTGSRLRSIRLNRHLTLQQVADQCDCTRSLLSKIENGRTCPPVATLTRIAQALGTTVAALIEDQSAETCTHTRARDITAKSLVTTRAGYAFHCFAGHRGAKRMQPYLFVARRGQIKNETLTHAGEEFVYVLDGRMEYRVGDVRYELGPGDSLYFDSSEPHGLAPLTASVRYLAVFAAPGSGTTSAWAPRARTAANTVKR
jgi:quercetin dioxygenase-like cupin family protein/DNA-binding XRE family transcriptional regulator